jgi:pimeloyl-ACP methyl ester carboxylesterase
MRLPAFLLILSVSWAFAPKANALPEVVARYILGRPVTAAALEKQLGMLNGILDPLIGSSEAISISEHRVGDPEVKLSVLIVEPRHYGITVTDTIDLEAKKYSVNLTAKGGPERPEGENGKPPSQETVSRMIVEQARKGATIPSTSRPRTLFLLNGYGVPKKAGLPLALLLAEHGIRTVMPDLRGQGESGGSGVTWGKEEPGDLSDLLTILQKEGVVEAGPVAVLGISYGAAMACLWAAQDERVDSAILVAPYSRADTKMIAAHSQFLGGTQLPFQAGEELLREGTRLAAERLAIRWEDVSPATAVKTLDRPVFFLTSSGDEVVPQREVEDLHGLAPKGSKLHVFKGLPHLLLGIHFTELESRVVEWLDSEG